MIYVKTRSKCSILKLLQSHKSHQSLPDSTTIRQPYAKYQTMTSCFPNQLQSIQRAITNLSTVIQNGRKNGSLAANQAFGLFSTPFSHYMFLNKCCTILFTRAVCTEKV